jgi:hypothetical protein
LYLRSWACDLVARASRIPKSLGRVSATTDDLHKPTDAESC